MILFIGGAFLIYKAATEIFAEVEGDSQHGTERSVKVTFFGVITQIIILDLVFSLGLLLDSVITVVGIAGHIEVIAAITIAILLMMIAATPIARFVEHHPSTKMLALAFLVMVGMSPDAEGLGFGSHIERAFIYATMIRGRRRGAEPVAAEAPDENPHRRRQAALYPGRPRRRDAPALRRAPPAQTPRRRFPREVFVFPLAPLRRFGYIRPTKRKRV